MTYIIIFTLSLVCIYIALKTKKNSKITFYIFSFVGLLLPCLLAALRSLYTGTDVQVYIYPLYNTSLKYNDFFTFFKYPYSTINDILYLLTTYVGARITNNIGGVFFLNQLLVIVPIYVAINKKFKNQNQVTFAMIIYYFMFYNITLNIARQSIAVAFSILALTFLDENKNFKYILISICAFLFHKSAIIMLPIFIIHKILKDENNNKFMKSICKTIIFLTVIITIFILPSLIRFMIRLGIYTEKFTTILQFIRGIDINFIDTAMYIIIFLIMFVNKIFLSKNNKNFEFYYFLSFISIFVLQLGTIVKFSDRIGMYLFYAPLFLFVPSLYTYREKKYINKNRLMSCIVLIISIIFYWFFWIVIVNRHETYPYIFNSF